MLVARCEFLPRHAVVERQRSPVVLNTSNTGWKSLGPSPRSTRSHATVSDMVTSNGSIGSIENTPPTVATTAPSDAQQDQSTSLPRLSPAAERMRLSRQRRRDGMRVIPFEIRDDDIEGLVIHGLLDPADRKNPDAIATALGTLMNKIPLSWWAVALRR